MARLVLTVGGAGVAGAADLEHHDGGRQLAALVESDGEDVVPFDLRGEALRNHLRQRLLLRLRLPRQVRRAVTAQRAPQPRASANGRSG